VRRVQVGGEREREREERATVLSKASACHVESSPRVAQVVHNGDLEAALHQLKHCVGANVALQVVRARE
jgi:hypothetical protein